MLFINNDVVKSLLTVRDCIEIQERAFQQLESGASLQRPRIDMYVPCERDDGYYRWGTMEGANDGIFAIRMKSDIVTWPVGLDGNWVEEKYCIQPGTWCGLIMLFSTQNGEPLAFINDGEISHYRVGGSAGIGAKHLAKENASKVGMLGSGGMARSYLEAFCAVRPIASCKVYSPTKINRERYAKEMNEKLSIDVIPVEAPEKAVRGADIVASCTSTLAPTIDASWLEPGMHITDLDAEDVDEACLRRIDVKIRQGEGGIPLAESGRIKRLVGHSPVAYVAGTEDEMKRLPPRPHIEGQVIDRAWPTYCDLVTGRCRGRESDQQITFYHNYGNQGLQFSAVGGQVFRKARDAGLGHSIPTSWFLENIRN